MVIYANLFILFIGCWVCDFWSVLSVLSPLKFAVKATYAHVRLATIIASLCCRTNLSRRLSIFQFSANKHGF